jgi:hypothetical protein
MADPKEPSEADKLLAEVEGMLDPPVVRDKKQQQRQQKAVTPADGSDSAVLGRLRAAVLAGAVAGVGVWVMFALLPFLRAGSGGTGAFLAAFVAVLLLYRRKR